PLHPLSVRATLSSRVVCSFPTRRSSDLVRRAQLDQALQTVVTVDDTAIQVVQVRRRETAAVQRNQRAQLGRNDRNNGQDHPLRADRKSTRLNSSHVKLSYAVLCLNKKTF